MTEISKMLQILTEKTAGGYENLPKSPKLYELIGDSIAASHLQHIHTHAEGHFDMETHSGAGDRPMTS